MTQALGQPITEIDCQPGQIPGGVDALNERQTPCVLKGLVADWPLVKAAKAGNQQAVDYLLSFYQQQPVSAFLAEPKVKGRFFYNDELTGFNFVQQHVYLDELLNKLLEIEGQTEVPTYYVGSTAIDKALPGFLAQQDLPLDQYQPLKSIWLGNQSCIAPHFDFPLNIACCVIGKRRFTLFPPEQLENLYLGPIDRTPAGQQISMVDLAEPDLERFPKFSEAMAAAVYADLTPGDALFVPSMWWHQVESFSAINGLVNYWWRATPQHLGAPSDALLAAMLSIKDLPKAQRKAWQNLFNYYIFEQPEDALEHLPEHAHGRLGEISEPIARQLRAQLLNNLKS